MKKDLLDAFAPDLAEWISPRLKNSRARSVWNTARLALPIRGHVPLPAIVHWRVNHYAAVVAFVDGRYEVKDPTFGQESLWIRRRPWWPSRMVTT